MLIHTIEKTLFWRSAKWHEIIILMFVEKMDEFVLR